MNALTSASSSPGALFIGSRAVEPLTMPPTASLSSVIALRSSSGSPRRSSSRSAAASSTAAAAARTRRASGSH